MTTLSDDAIARLRHTAMWPELPGDRYVGLRKIGSGGMGTLYAALDTRLNREVAIKVSNASDSTAGPAALDTALAMEAQVLARLEHPGIVPVHDAGHLGDGRAFYVMKLVDGRTLADARDQTPDVMARLSIFERLVDTVAFAHAAGVIHRDLTPANVMIGAYGEVLVLDWGTAQVGVSQASTGLRVGTPAYMAPEQARGEAVTAAADVFSLGAVARWLFSGLPIDKRLSAIVEKCLAPHAADRYASAADLTRDLAAHRGGGPVSAYVDTWRDLVGAWFDRHRVFIGIVAAYLLMRATFAWYSGR